MKKTLFKVVFLILYSIKMPPKKIKTSEQLAELLSSTSISSSNTNSNAASNTNTNTNSSASSAALGDKRQPNAVLNVKPTAGDSDRLQFALAINNLTARSEALVAALQEIQTFDRDRIQTIEMKLEAKKKEYADMTQTLSTQYEQAQKQLENEYIDAKIKCNQDIREHGLVAANNLLATMNMTSISVDKLNGMVNELSTIKDAHATTLKKELDDSHHQAKQELSRQISALQLEHKATVASLQAQVEQQVKEIRVLNDTISSLKHELAEQRTLTKEVAQASSKSQISQNFGNK
jgi:hypothetical protein